MSGPIEFIRNSLIPPLYYDEIPLCVTIHQLQTFPWCDQMGTIIELNYLDNYYT